MPMSTAEIFGQGLLGAFVGAGKGAAQAAENELREQMTMAREERLSKLRRGEYLEKLKTEQAMKDAEGAKRASFYERTGPREVEQPGVEVDESGKEIGIITGLRNESRRETADRRMEEARKTGDEKLMKQTFDEAKDIRAEEDLARKTKVDETRAEAAARLAAVKEREADARERDNERKERLTNAQIAKLMGGGADGEKAEPAKIREVRALAKIAFNGDEEKAAAFVYNTRDQNRTEAVLRMASVLKSDLRLAQKPDELMARAEKMVDALREKDVPSRGGASIDGRSPEPKAESAPAKPRNKAEYDALPSGALYVHRDGKTYRKP